MPGGASKLGVPLLTRREELPCAMVTTEPTLSSLGASAGAERGGAPFRHW